MVNSPLLKVLIISWWIVISDKIRFDFLSCLFILFRMNADAIGIEAGEHRVPWVIELFGKIIGLADKDLAVDHFIHFVGGAVRNKIDGANLFEQRCYRLNKETVFFP